MSGNHIVWDESYFLTPAEVATLGLGGISVSDAEAGSE